MRGLYHTCLLLLLSELLIVQADHSVHFLSENFDQFVTSTTLKWVPSNGHDKSLLSNAVIAAYQTVEEQRDNEPGDEEMQSVSYDLVKKPIYICRATFNSVLISGQLRPNKSVCIVSLYKEVSERKDFEILVSIEGSARLSWIHKNKYTLVSPGAVMSGENDIRSFIARRPANSHDKEGSLSHTVGKYNPNENLGVFYLVDQNNIERQFEDGEILVETEPKSYHLKSVKFERFRGRFPKVVKELGFAVLKNEEDSLQRAAIMINYKYNYSLLWGKDHGLQTGLPITVTLPNGTTVKGQWALPLEEERSEVAPVEKYLEAGTAINVTIIGNYTESEVPYNATVVALYEDGEKRAITIRDTKRENTILDVAAVYSPIYFLHNNSHVPTTTTTTAASTSGTTSSTTSKTTSTTQISPIISPELITTLTTVDGKQDEQPSNNMVSDDQNAHRHDSSAKQPSTEPDSSSSMGMFSLVTILLVSLVILRVT